MRRPFRFSDAFVEGFAPLRIGQNPHEQAGGTQRIGETEYTKFGWALKAVFYARERQALNPMRVQPMFVSAQVALAVFRALKGTEPDVTAIPGALGQVHKGVVARDVVSDGETVTTIDPAFALFQVDSGRGPGLATALAGLQHRH
ncbi:MAG: hypothetical protein IMZ61_07765, partial [Planctomycetes bacterium]|nr:hypothetical protein [Planctomycetota bacterium]